MSIGEVAVRVVRFSSRWTSILLLLASVASEVAAEPLPPCGGCNRPNEPCMLRFGATGVVRDKVTGEPISGATIAVLDLPQGTSAADGSFLVESYAETHCHPDYFYSLSVSAPGYKTYSFSYYATFTFPTLTVELEPDDDPEGFIISGTVAEFPPCSGRMRGVTVVLEPLGWTTQTSIGPADGGTYAFEHVPPGDYTVRVALECNPYGCWTPEEVTVGESDENVVVCMQGEGGSPTPTLTACPARTPCVYGEHPRPCNDQPCGLGCGCEPCPACAQGEVIGPIGNSCECIADPSLQTPTPTPTSTPLPLGTAASCPGDCDADGAIGVQELLVAVAVSLGGDVRDGCTSFDRDQNGDVGASELVTLVNAALNGCR